MKCSALPRSTQLVSVLLESVPVIGLTHSSDLYTWASYGVLEPAKDDPTINSASDNSKVVGFLCERSVSRRESKEMQALEEIGSSAIGDPKFSKDITQTLEYRSDHASPPPYR